ncbi:Uncharacterised protein [Corynebacterium urealyticum]|nr:Uncharacterised protein [Corynebacterium urealyticum]
MSLLGGFPATNSAKHTIGGAGSGARALTRPHARTLPHPPHPLHVLQSLRSVLGRFPATNSAKHTIGGQGTGKWAPSRGPDRGHRGTGAAGIPGRGRGLAPAPAHALQAPKPPKPPPASGASPRPRANTSPRPRPPAPPSRFAEFDVAFAGISDIKLCKTHNRGARARARSHPPAPTSAHVQPTSQEKVWTRTNRPLILHI